MSELREHPRSPPQSEPAGCDCARRRIRRSRSRFGRPMGFIHVVEYPKCGGSWVRNMLQTYTGTPRIPRRPAAPPRRRDPGAPAREALVCCGRSWSRAIPATCTCLLLPRDAVPESGEASRHRALLPARPEPAAARGLRALPRSQAHARHPSALHARRVRALLAGAASVPSGCATRTASRTPRPSSRASCRRSGSRSTPSACGTPSRSTASRTPRAERGQERKPGEADPGAFERKGIAGDWKNHFDRRSCELLERYEGASLRALGYEPDAGWIERFLKG